MSEVKGLLELMSVRRKIRIGGGLEVKGQNEEGELADLRSEFSACLLGQKLEVGWTDPN